VDNPSYMQEGSLQYDEEELNDKCLKKVLQQGYEAYHLFNGSMYSTYEKGDPPPPGTYTPTGEGLLRESLAGFFEQWVPAVDLKQANIFNTLSGINFLPVDKQTFLAIQYFVNLTENHFPQVKASALLYDDHLVWSGLDQDIARTIYRLATDPNGRQSGRAPSSISKLVRWASVDEGQPIRLHVRGCGGLALCPCETQKLVALFLVEDSEAHPAKLDSLSDFVNSEAANLAKLIFEHYSPQTAHDESWKYVYFNEMNLALKSSMKPKKIAELSPEVMAVLNEMHTQLDKPEEICTELCVRQQKDGWILGRKSNQRMLYAILESKGSTLAEISDDLDQLLAQCFNNIFI